MADTKISALTAATTPLAGTEVLPIVQGGVTKQVSVANLTAGRDVSANTMTQNINYTTARAASAPTYGGNYYMYSGAGLNSAVAGIEWQYATAGAGYGFKINADGGSDSLQIGYRKNSATWTLAAAFDYNGNQTLSNGNLVIGTSGKGIDFSATSQSGGMTSELLADYEEGTWTPTDGSGAGLTFTVYGATYTKVGRQVTCNVQLTYPSTASSATAVLAGLPFAAGYYGYGSVQGFYSTRTSTFTSEGAYGTNGASSVAFDKNNGASNATNADWSGKSLYMTIIYQV